MYSTSQQAHTSLRSVLEEVVLDDLQSRRETLNVKPQNILDRHTNPRGIDISLVEEEPFQFVAKLPRSSTK